MVDRAAAQRIAEQFPFLKFLANDPEIGPLLGRATDPNAGFSSEKFRAEIMKTKWWRRNSETDRAWLIKKSSDPAEAKRIHGTAMAGLQQLSQAKFGRNLNHGQLLLLGDWVARSQMELNDPRVLSRIASLMPKDTQGWGEQGIIGQQIRATAEGQWFTKLSTNTILNHARNVTLGKTTVENINARLAMQARGRYPWLADRIGAGETLADITDGHRQLAAEELETDPGNINIFASPVWRQLLGVKDSASGKMRPPTDNEVIRLARNRQSWWTHTSKGRQADAGWTSAMLKTFGVRA